VSDYPTALVEANHVEPVPRRIRAVLAGRTIVDTTNALYVWEWSAYPQFYIPLADVRTDSLVDENATDETPRGEVALFGLRVGDQHLPRVAKVLHAAKVRGLDETVRFEWSAFDAWYEEDEQVFVHPRNPYTRIDVLRSSRRLRVEAKGVVLADSASPVMLYETGLPTRYYVNRTDVDFSHLVRSDTVTQCPYKGVTSGYWSADVGATVHPDVAWTYVYPLREVLPIAGLIAFYNEKVDLFLDGERLDRPHTQFARSR
jgi:uncharacterized protein (DUF427 family)